MACSDTKACPDGEACFEHICRHHPGCFRRREQSFKAVAATGATPKYVPREDRFIADEDLGLRGVLADSNKGGM